jgi:EPS-associated MarR family transcriptional regulator
MSDINDHFEVLRKIQKRPETTQRELAEELGFSLGKLNYCMKALQDKGLITIQNFRRNPKKINYLYTLTAKGNEHKFNLTLKFMKKKMQEYYELKKEINNKNEKRILNDR